MADRHRQAAKALLNLRGRTQPGSAHARALQHGHAAEPATVRERPGGGCFVLAFRLPYYGGATNHPTTLPNGVLGLPSKTVNRGAQRRRIHQDFGDREYFNGLLGDAPALPKYVTLIFAKRPAEELYDLYKDPDQLQNVAGDSSNAEQRA